MGWDREAFSKSRVRYRYIYRNKWKERAKINTIYSEVNVEWDSHRQWVQFTITIRDNEWKKTK